MKKPIYTIKENVLIPNTFRRKRKQNSSPNVNIAWVGLLLIFLLILISAHIIIKLE